MKIGTFGILILILTSCQHLFQLKSDQNLTKKIEIKFNEESAIVDLSKLNDFTWDNLLIFEPYSLIERTEKELNLNLSNIRENGIRSRDDINLLVFMKNGKSIKISELTREVGDFEQLRKLIAKKKAKFRISEKGLNILAE